MALAYVLITGWIIIAGHGVPYVIDGNETFSVYWHSYNLFHFDFWKSFGLSDDAYSPEVAAHAVIHPHQGNWPRVFGFLIYLLGARTPASQVVVTSFSVGVVAMFMAYHFMARRISPLFATLFCLVLISDYVLFLQWQVVTYRVWHVFFFFSSLLCAESWKQGRKGRSIVLTLLNYACLYYYEFVFVAYVSVLVGTFTLYLYHRRVRLLLLAVGSQLAGAATGLLVLFTQLIQFYGLDGFKADFYYTFLARNHVASMQQLLADMKAFYESHNIAFFYNFGENTNYLHILTFLKSIFSYDLQVHTPLLSTLILAVAVPAFLVIGLLPAEQRRFSRRARLGLAVCTGLGVVAAVLAARAFAGNDMRWFAVFGAAAFAALCPLALWVGYRLFDEARGLAGVAASLIADALLAVAFGLLVLAVTSSFMGDAAAVQDHWVRGRRLFDIGVDALVLVAIAKWLGGLGSWVTRQGARFRVVVAAVLVGGMAAFIRDQPALYAESAAALWRALAAVNVPVGVVQFAIVAAMVLAIQPVLAPQRLGQVASQIRELRIFLVCGLIGYGFAFMMSAGYVFSGYLDRTAPFTVFLTDGVVAMAVFVLACQLIQGWRASRAATADRPAWIASTVAAAGVAAVLVSGWLRQQVAYAEMLPPDHAAFMNRLAEAPFRGATFTVNTYAAPIAAYTDQWAYDSESWAFWARQQQSLSSAPGSLAADQPDGVGSLPYLWLADRRTNTAYETPQYFLCFVNQTLSTLTASLADPAGDRSRGCASVDTAVRTAAQDPFQVLTPRVVARDEEGIVRRGWEAWSIVRLDWDYPPSLTPEPGTTDAKPVAVAASRVGGVTRLSFGYAYAHPTDVPEAGTEVRLLRFGSNADCGSEDWRAKTMASRRPGGADRFDLPATVAGRFAVEVTPRTAAKAGRPYYSTVLSFDGTGAPPTPCSKPPLLPGEPSPEEMIRHGYLVPGHLVDLSGPGPATSILGTGWSTPEAAGTWSLGVDSTMTFRLLDPLRAPVRLSADVSAFILPQHPRAAVAVVVDGETVATWRFTTAAARTMTADIPAALLAGKRKLDISFVSKDAVSPAELGASADARPLKLRFSSLTIGGVAQSEATGTAAAYKPGEVLSFTTSGQGSRYVGQGWSVPEPPGTWAIDDVSTLALSWPKGAARPARLTAEVMPFVVPGDAARVVDVIANGRRIASWSLTPSGFTTRTADIPANILGPDGRLSLRLESDAAPSPAALGLNTDVRALKLLVRSIVVDPAS